MDKEKKIILFPKCQRQWLLKIWHYDAPHKRGRHHSPLGSKEWNIAVLKFRVHWGGGKKKNQFQIFPPNGFQRKLFPNLFLAFKTPTIMNLGTTPKSSMISASFYARLRYLQTAATKTSVLTIVMQSVWILQKQGKLVYTDMRLVFFNGNSNFSFSARKAIGKIRMTIWKKLPLC